jgi:hypothetical protein
VGLSSTHCLRTCPSPSPARPCKTRAPPPGCSWRPQRASGSVRMKCIDVSMGIWVWMCIEVSMYVNYCMYACMCVWEGIGVYVCMNLYVFMYVYMCICSVYVCVLTCVCSKDVTLALDLLRAYREGGARRLRGG